MLFIALSACNGRKRMVTQKTTKNPVRNGKHCPNHDYVTVYIHLVEACATRREAKIVLGEWLVLPSQDLDLEVGQPSGRHTTLSYLRGDGMRSGVPARARE